MFAKDDSSTDVWQIAAIDAHAADVVRVAELDRLFDVNGLVRVVAGQVQRRNGAPEAADEQEKRQDTEPGVDVGVAMEELTHRVDVQFGTERTA